MKINKLFISLGILILLGITISAYSTYGSPSEFGNETTTTCWIGGDNGELNCTGNARLGELLIGNGSNDNLGLYFEEGFGSYVGSIISNFEGGIGALLIEGNAIGFNFLSGGLIQFFGDVTIGDHIVLNESTGNIITNSNITADYFFGDGSQLTKVNVTNMETDPYWTANQSSYSTTAEILAFGFWNSTFALFNKSYADTLYHIEGNELTDSLNWTYLENYPTACPAGSAITQLNDSVTCTSFAQENTDVTFNNITAEQLNLTNGAYSNQIYTNTNGTLVFYFT